LSLTDLVRDQLGDDAAKLASGEATATEPAAAARLILSALNVTEARSETATYEQSTTSLVAGIASSAARQLQSVLGLDTHVEGGGESIGEVNAAVEGLDDEERKMLDHLTADVLARLYGRVSARSEGLVGARA